MAETDAKDGLIDVTVLIMLFRGGLQKGLGFGLENLLCTQSYYNGSLGGGGELGGLQMVGACLACEVSDRSLRVP